MYFPHKLAENKTKKKKEEKKRVYILLMLLCVCCICEKVMVGLGAIVAHK